MLHTSFRALSSISTSPRIVRPASTKKCVIVRLCTLPTSVLYEVLRIYYNDLICNIEVDKRIILRIMRIFLKQ